MIGNEIENDTFKIKKGSELKRKENSEIQEEMNVAKKINKGWEQKEESL